MLSPDVLMETLLSIFAMLVIAVLLYMIGFAGYCAQRMLCSWVASWPLWRLPLHKIVGLCVLAVAAGLFGRKATNPNDAPPPLMAQGQGSGLTVEGFDEGDGIARTNGFFISHVSSTENGWSLGVSWRAGMVPEDDTVDLFSCSDLVSNDWRWVKGMAVVSGMTNCLFTIGSDELVPTNAPRQFFKVNVRGSVASGMEDFDGDGLPNVYELEHDCNPYVDDYALVEKRTVGPDGTHATLQAALANSTPYTVIELLPEMGRVEYSTSISMPAHPVMIVGPPDGYARIRYSGYIGAFILDAGQDGRTLFRNIYLELTGHSSPIAGFWCGASTAPLTNTGTATFENIYIRMMNSSPTYYGWYFQRANFRETRIDHCVVNAEGAQHATGVRCVDASHLEICGCSFLNFPAEPQHAFAAILLGATGIGGMSNVCTEVSRSLFDGSFSNQYAIAYFDPVTDDAIAFRDCILPTSLCDYIPTVTDALLITNALVTKAGFPLPDSPASLNGIGALDSTCVSATRDSDGDGLIDCQEVFIHDTNPWNEDSDGDKFNDAVEISMGSDPNDASNFCFTASFCVTNDYVGGGVRLGVWANADIDDSCLASCALTSRVNRICFSHLMATNGAQICVRLWADWNTNGIWNTEEPTVGLALNWIGESVCSSAKVSRSLVDNDNDQIIDIWEIQHGLSPTNYLDSLLDDDDDGLLNIQEFLYGGDPSISMGTNNMFYIVSHSIDSRILNRNPTNAYYMFENYFMNGSNHVFQVNANFWASDVDFSGICVWNSQPGEENQRAGSLLSPRHWLVADHWKPKSNQETLYFRGRSGAIYEAHMVTNKSLNNLCSSSVSTHPDVAVVLLDRDINTNDVSIIPVLSPELLLKIGDGYGVPYIDINQRKEAQIKELTSLTNGGSYPAWHHIGFMPSKNPLRANFMKDRYTISGDSSSPTFLLIGNQLVLLGLHSRTNSDAPVFMFVQYIQQAMDELYAGYSLLIYDLSIFQGVHSQ